MKKMDSMNLVPFIDIILVLLVIVLTSATFINASKIPIEIPKSQEVEGSRESQQDEITLSISENGNFFLGDELLAFSTLSSRLANLDKNTSIILKGDRRSQFDAFVQVMQILQKNRLDNVFILVEESKK